MTEHRFLFASVDSSPKVGGVSLLAKRVSKELLKNFGAEAVYLGPKGTYFVDDELPMKLYEDHQSDTKLRAGPYSPAEDKRIRDLGGAILDNYGLNAVILWHPFYYGPGLIHAAKSRNLPVAVFVHGTELTSQIPDVLDGPSTFTFEENSTELSHRLFYTMENADVILTNSSYSASLIRNLVPQKEITVARCGIDSQIFDRELALQPQYSRLDKALAREDLGLPERRTLIHVGRLVPHKNQRQSIEMIANMPEAQLIIIGDGPDLGKLQDLADQLDVKDRVFFVGQVDDAKKWAYLRASDAGLLISNFNEETGGYEGFGITMVEYTAAACAVLSTGEYGMSDFAVKYECAFLVLNDTKTVASHAKRLNAFLADEVELAEHIDRTRTLSRKYFTWSKVAENVMGALPIV